MSLDAWLRRAPLAPRQVHSDRDGDSQEQQQEQAAGTESDEEERPAAKTGPLDAFLQQRRDATEEATTSYGDSQPRTVRPRHLSRSVLSWQSTGRLDGWAAAALQHRHWGRLQQRAVLETHAWQQPVVGSGGGAAPVDEAGAVQCAQFDSQGELLVTGSEEGLLTIHSTGHLLAACSGSARGGERLPASQQRLATASPLLVLHTRMPKLQAVRWNPADENVVGVASSATRQLHLYDLQHTQGQPKQILSLPPAASAVAGTTAVGASDLAFFARSGSGYQAMAAGLGGQVLLWDARAKAAPVAALQAAHAGALYALQLAPDEQVVLAGTQSREVRLWDLRGGSGGTACFGGMVHHHPPLCALSLRQALSGVPGLAAQAGIPASAVHSMQLDPRDSRRLAFHLGCGWSGVLDLCSGEVTHLHAPPPAHTEEQAVGEGGLSALQTVLWGSTAAPGLHRHGCWTADGSRYCVPSRREDSLSLLDFSPSRAAGCSVHSAADTSLNGHSHSGRSADEAAQLPSAVHVPLSLAAVCVAAHPRADLLVAGSMQSCVSVVGL